MSQATFYTHVSRPAEFTVRLAARAVRDGGRVLVWTYSAADAAALSRDLWQVLPESFLAHEIRQPHETMPQECPIVVSSGPLIAVPQNMVVLNLSDAFWHAVSPPPARVLEIVGASLEDLADARERFRAYRENGFAIEHHNMGGKA